MRLDLDVKGDKAAVAKIDELSDRAGNIRPVLTKAGQIIKDGIAAQVAGGGSHLGGKGSPWPKLAQETLTRKAREGLSAKTLDATGHLIASLGGGSGHVFKVATTQVRVGTKDFKARFHQGGREGRGTEPARKLVGIAKADRSSIFRLIRKHMTV